MARLFYAFLLGILGAALVHIAIVLLVPHYTGGLLWRGLKAAMPAYRFAALPAGNPLSRAADPFFRQRLCRFNLAESPVHLSARAGAPFWSLSIYSDKGKNLYSINSASAPGGGLDIIAIDPAELMDFKHNLPENFADSALTALNDGRDFAVLRVLLPSADRQEQADAFLASAQCAPADY